MILFKCHCGWNWVVGKKNVYGPIYPMNLPGHVDYGCLTGSHVIMSRKFWEDTEGDCYNAFIRSKKSYLFSTHNILVDRLGMNHQH